MTSHVVSMTEFKSLTLRGRGKVRDIYDLGDRLLIVATARISAFDVVERGLTDCARAVNLGRVAPI